MGSVNDGLTADQPSIITIPFRASRNNINNNNNNDDDGGDDNDDDDDDASSACFLARCRCGRLNHRTESCRVIGTLTSGIFREFFIGIVGVPRPRRRRGRPAFYFRRHLTFRVGGGCK